MVTVGGADGPRRRPSSHLTVAQALSLILELCLFQGQHRLDQWGVFMSKLRTVSPVSGTQRLQANRHYKFIPSAWMTSDGNSLEQQVVKIMRNVERMVDEIAKAKSHDARFRLALRIAEGQQRARGLADKLAARNNKYWEERKDHV